MHLRTLATMMALVAILVLTSVSAGSAMAQDKSFRRIATFPAIANHCGLTVTPGNTDCFDFPAVAEIVASALTGNLLVYTDSFNQEVGFVDISDHTSPQPGGTVGVAGELTSVAVAGRYALVGVNTSPSFIAPSGHLTIIDLVTRSVVPGAAALDLGGQPDSVAVSPSGRYAAIVIENERDEDLGDGEPPQAPPGFLVVVDLQPNHPSAWTLTPVSLTGFAASFPGDPEPEYVDINSDNIAVVSLQENNHFVFVDLETKSVVGNFGAGTVDLTDVDTLEEDVINLNSDLEGVPREPDAVTWINNRRFASANEGDLFGGSCGFSIFDRFGGGQPVFDSAEAFEYEGVRIGHYPEGRSENKGTEPETIEFGRIEGRDLLVVGSERGSYIVVYGLDRNGIPEFVQVLVGGVAPEGLHLIPEKKLLIVANEDDNIDDMDTENDPTDDRSDRDFRAGITIFEYQQGEPTYPTIESVENSPPVPWAAISGLGAHPTDPDLGYVVSDSAYAIGFVYPMDLGLNPALITSRIAVPAPDLDLEGVTVRSDDTLWLASEGDDNPDLDNRIVAFDPDTETVLATVVLPPSVQAQKTNNGFEGVAVNGTVGVDETVYVAFQREWGSDPDGKVRIGVYEVGTGDWTFFYYPLDAVASPNGGWVGLSEIVSLGGGSFAVLERDNQSGLEARIKRIYRFAAPASEPDCNIGGDPEDPDECDFPTAVKVLVRDLMPDFAATGGAIIEKIEGLAVTADGRTIINTDNDAVDDSNGETQQIDLGFGVLP